MPRVDPEVFDLYFKKKGFTWQTLSEACRIDASHLRKIRRKCWGGTRAVKNIAGAFGIPVNYLETGIYPILRPTLVHTQKYDATIIINIPHTEMSIPAIQNEKLASLQKFVGCTAKIEIEKILEGSTILEVTMTASDILRLLAAMMDNQLEVLNIKSISIPSPSWLSYICAILHLDKGKFDPQRLDPDATSALLDADHLKHKLSLQSDICSLCKTLTYPPVGTP